MVENIATEAMKIVFSHHPLVMREYGNYIQIVFTLKEIPSDRLYSGFERLRRLFGEKYSIRILFVPKGEMQVLIGDKEAIAPVGQNNSDFILDIC